MVIINIRLPTGYEANEETINSLIKSHDLRRFELNQNKINLYFDEVRSCFEKKSYSRYLATRLIFISYFQLSNFI